MIQLPLNQFIQNFRSIKPLTFFKQALLYLYRLMESSQKVDFITSPNDYGRHHLPRIDATHSINELLNFLDNIDPNYIFILRNS